jgi:hypothetical protein
MEEENATLRKTVEEQELQLSRQVIVINTGKYSSCCGMDNSFTSWQPFCLLGFG